MQAADPALIDAALEGQPEAVLRLSKELIQRGRPDVASMLRQATGVTSGRLPSPRTALDAMAETGLKPIPVLGAIESAADTGRLWAASRRLEAGKGSQEDEKLVLGFLEDERRKEARGATTGYYAMRILTELPAFAGEFIGTGGLYTAGRKGAEKAARTAAGKAVRQSIERVAGKTAASLAVKAAGATAGSALQAAANVPRIVGATLERAMPTWATTEDETGEAALVLVEGGKSFIRALPEGYADTLIEYVSERAGAGIAQVPGVSRLVALQGRILEKIAGGSKAKLGTLLKQVGSEAGWHGVIAEMGEERFASVLRAAVLDDPWEDVFPGGKQLAAEAIAFSVPGVVSAAATKAANAALSKGSGEQAGAEAALGVVPEAPPEPSQFSPAAAPAPSPERLRAREGAVGLFLGTQDRQGTVVEPSSPIQQSIAQAVRERGGDPVFVRSPDLQAFDLPAMTDPRSGVVVFDAAQRPEEMQRAFLRHEVLAHLLKGQDPAAWQALYDEVRAADPDGLAEAEAGYTADFARITGRTLSTDAASEEGLGRTVESLSRWMDAVTAQPGRVEALLEKAEGRSMLRRLVEALKRAMSRLTGGRVLSARQELDALDALLGGPEGMSLEDKARVAGSLNRAWSAMQGAKLPALEAVSEAQEAPQAPRGGYEPSPATPETEALMGRARKSGIQSVTPESAPATRPQPSAPATESPLTPKQRRLAERRANKARGEAEALRAAPARTSVEAREQLRRARELEAKAPKPTRGPVTRRPLESRQAMAERLSEEGREDQIRFAVSPDPLGFYSRMEQVLDEKIQGKRATVAQVRALLRDVKEEEVEWSGIEDFLKGKQAVSKDELMQFVRENNVQVQEVTLGAGPPHRFGTPQEQRAALERLMAARRGLTSAVPGTPEYNAARDEHRAAEAAMTNIVPGWGRAEGSLERPTKHSTYQLPGGENYRELLLTLPRGEGSPAYEALRARRKRLEPRLLGEEFSPGVTVQDEMRRIDEEMSALQNSGHFTGGHFDEPNVLAHVRFNERTDAEGARVLFIEEVQSDWHQEGRKKGYGAADRWVIYRSLSATQREFVGYSETEEGAKAMAADLGAGPQSSPYVRYEVVKESWRQGVPDAPFKTSWHELALKRMVRWGAEHGFDAVAWTTGAQQVERYETALRQVADSHSWGMEQGRKRVRFEKGGRVTLSLSVDDRGVVTGTRSDGGAAGELAGKPLEDVVGKEAAQRILESPSGEGGPLTIGGQGMSGFYDQMLPAAANKIGKRFGARVEPAYIVKPETRVSFEEMQRRRSGGKVDPESLRAQVHSLPITPDMRATVMQQGFPRFAASQQPDGSFSFDVPAQSQSRVWYEGLVNRMERLVSHEKAAPRKKASPADVEALLPGRAKDRVDRLERRQNAILRDLAKAGGTLEELDEYLKVAHAPARNEAIREAEGEAWDVEENPGSGIPTSEAKRRKAELDKGPKGAALRKAAASVYELRDERLDILFSGGLLSAAERDGWIAKYGDTYVPMRTIRDPEETYIGRSAGYQVRGPESKAARGRTTETTDVTAQVFAQGQEAIMRVERAKIGQELLKLIRANPDPGVWQELGSKAEIPDGMLENTFTVKEGGVEQVMLLRDAAFARSMRELQTKHGLEALNKVQAIATFYKRLHTSWNLSFIAPNLVRDYLTAAVHLTSEQGRAFAVKTLNPIRVGGAFRGMLAAIRDPDGTSGGDWGARAREFMAEGGRTAWVDVPLMRRRIAEMRRVMSDTNATPARRLALWMGGMVKLLEQSSDAVENAVRLSTYASAVEAGMSKGKAALLGKRVTVNFNQKGRWSCLLGTQYLFFNPGVQGTNRIAEVFANPKSRTTAAQISAGIFATGAAMSLLNYMLGGEDDDGEGYWSNTPFWERERNMVWLVPGTDGFQVKMPLPWGYNVLFNMGSNAVRVLVGDDSPAQSTAEIGGSAFAAFSPIAGEANLAQWVAPWYLDPWVQAEQNQTWYGAPIQPPANPFDRTPPPASQNFYATVSPAARNAAQFMSRLTGGNEIEGGLVEVSPEILEHWAAFLGGGAGREAVRGQNVASRLISGEEVPVNQIPVLRRFFGRASDRYVAEDYYENLSRIEVEQEKRAARLPFDKSVLRLRGAATSLQRRLKALRARRDAAKTPQERETWEDRIKAEMKKLNRRMPA